MDKEHLIDLISNSIISEIKDLEINEEKLIANNGEIINLCITALKIKFVQLWKSGLYY